MKKSITAIYLITISLTACTRTDYELPQHNTTSIARDAVIENELCLYSCPTGADTTNILVDHHIYLLSFNRDTKFAD